MNSQGILFHWYTLYMYITILVHTIILSLDSNVTVFPV